MTSEHRGFITPDEILQIELRCGKKECGVSISIPVTQVTEKHFFDHQCPHCHQLWFQKDGSVEKALINLRNSLSALNADRQALGCVIRLEIKQEEKQKG